LSEAGISPLDLSAILIERRRVEDITQAAWFDLVTLAQAHHLAAYLWEILRQHRLAQFPAKLERLLRAESLNEVARFALYRQVFQQITAVLSTAAIPHLWLKGIVLAQTVYPAPHTRHMDDLDILIPVERCEEVISLLQQAGFRLVTSEQALFAHERIEPTLTNHHFVLEGGPGYLVPVELHYRLFGIHAQHLEQAALAWFWAHTDAIAPGVSSLDAETQLLHLSAHIMIQHGETDFWLSRYLDIHLHVTHYPLDWDAVVRAAEHLGWSYSLIRTLRTTQHYFDTPIPDTVWERLAALQAVSLDQHIAISLETPGNPWKSVRLSLKALPPGQRPAYIARILFPPRAYMRMRYQIPPKLPVLPYYPYRWLTQARKVVDAMRQRLNLPRFNGKPRGR
jgi:hypothetical protein